MKNILLFIAIMMIAGHAFAQFGGDTGLGSVWHYPGQYGLEGGFGRSPIGWIYTLSGSRYIQNNSYAKASIFQENGSFERVGYKSSGASLMYFYSPYSIQETVFFNVGIGGIGSYDQVKNFWPNNTGGFNYGGIGGVEVEAAVADYLMFTVSGLQSFMVRNDFGNKRFQIGVGVKFLIN